MLNFEQIKEYFDPRLYNINPKGVLVEYLQYEILDSLFKQKGSEHLSFIGGTAIRIVHGSQRFSEDLDFDNFGLAFSSFKRVMEKCLAEMKLKGFIFEARFLGKNDNYHLYVKFPKILFQLGISPHHDEKIFVSLDAQQKRKTFGTDVFLLNKLGVFRNIKVDPAPILLSQKLITILCRKREKGRDFYDASFLFGKTKPDFNYISKTMGLNKDEFADKFTSRCKKLDLKKLAQDVEPFLFDNEQKQRVLLFNGLIPALFS